MVKLHKKQWKRMMLTAGITLVALTGCNREGNLSFAQSSQSVSGENSVNGGGNETDKGQEAGENNTLGNNSATNQAVDGSVTAILAGGVQRSITYQEEDLKSDWDEKSSTSILLADGGIKVEGPGAAVNGNIVTIQKAGTYVVSGTLSDGQIYIDADKETIQLVFNGVTLTNKTTAPIYREDKGKTILTLAEGSQNVIQDQTAYQYTEAGQDEPDAPLFFKGDLTINGFGELEVAGNYQCGIRSKENLLVISGTIRIQSVDDGLKGKESVVIRDGVLDIQSGKDGIKSNQDQDDQAGYIWINGGTITIAADDDGIQAETALIINGGTIHITRSQEALAGKTIDILAGEIHAQAEDDGINSAASVETEREKAQDQEGVYTRIAGGEIYLNAMADGIDSNGDLYIEGGSLYLTGPSNGGNGILDYNGDATLSGGVVFAAGTASMLQTFKEATQNYLVVYYEENQEAGTEVRLLDAEGNVLGSHTPEKRFEAIIISTPELATGSTYQVVTGENTVEVTIEDIKTVSGNPSSGGRGMGGFRGAGRPESEEGMESGRPPERGPNMENGRPPERGANMENGEPPERGANMENGEPPERGANMENGEPPERGANMENGERPKRGQSMESGEGL